MSKQKSFQDLNLAPKLIKNLRSVLQWTTPTEVQETVIPLALAGRDLLAQSLTGSGKTGAFAIPLIERIILRGNEKYISALILSPTRELAEQITSVFQKMCINLQISIALITGGHNDIHSQQLVLKAEPDIVVATPGRILDHILNSTVQFDDLNVLIIDEADKLLELGFQKDLEQIFKVLPQKRQTMLFSATLSTQIEDLATLSLQKPLRVNIDTIQVNKNIQQQFIIVEEGNNHLEYKISLIKYLIQQFNGQKMIVFCDNKHVVQQVSQALQLLEIQSLYSLSSQLHQKQRDKAIYEFNCDPEGVLISTDLAARGLDIENVEIVVLANVPHNIDEYIHRVGRTGRYQKQGVSITIGLKTEIKQLVQQLNEGNKIKLTERLIQEGHKQNIAKQCKEIQGKEFKLKIKNLQDDEQQQKQLDKTEQMLNTYDKTNNYVNIQQKENRAWHLTNKDRKAVDQVIKQTTRNLISKKEASQMLKTMEFKKAKLKIQRGEDKQHKKGKAPRKPESVLQNKALMRKQRDDGEVVQRNQKLDARKIKKHGKK